MSYTTQTRNSRTRICVSGVLTLNARRDRIMDCKSLVAKFKELTDEQKDILRKAGKQNCLLLSDKGDWVGPGSPEGAFVEIYRYRLRPDYEECKCETCKDSGTIPSVHPHDSAYYGAIRPCPECEEKPEVVECSVFEDVAGWHCFRKVIGQTTQLLHCAVNHPDFIGFKYEDGKILPYSRKYEPGIKNVSGLYVNNIESGEYEVLTPTHVLFRKDKQWTA